MWVPLPPFLPPREKVTISSTYLQGACLAWGLLPFPHSGAERDVVGGGSLSAAATPTPVPKLHVSRAGETSDREGGIVRLYGCILVLCDQK